RAQSKLFIPKTVLKNIPSATRSHSEFTKLPGRPVSVALSKRAGCFNLPTKCHRISYQIPQSGLLSVLPSTWVPYAELIRIDKPTGTIYLFLPCLWATLLATSMSPIDVPISTALG